MRIRLRVSYAKPSPRPEPMRSFHFVGCQRCMGHGYFRTDPPQANPRVVFSLEGGLSYLNELLSVSGQISFNQYQVALAEVLVSGLPEEIPHEVAKLVSMSVAWEEQVVEFASMDQEEAACFTMVGADMADIVHSYLLKSPCHPWLRIN